MATESSGLRGFLITFTIAIYALSFFLPAWHDSAPVPGYEAFFIGMVYFFFVPLSIPWFANPIFIAAWLCLIGKGYSAAKVLGIIAIVFALSFLVIWLPWRRGGGVDWGYIFWCLSMVSATVSAFCLQFISAHYDELKRRAFMAEVHRWSSDGDGELPKPEAKYEPSTAIRESE
jgi:hypothetical protein